MKAGLVTSAVGAIVLGVSKFNENALEGTPLEDRRQEYVAECIEKYGETAKNIGKSCTFNSYQEVGLLPGGYLIPEAIGGLLIGIGVAMMFYRWHKNHVGR